MGCKFILIMMKQDCRIPEKGKLFNGQQILGKKPGNNLWKGP